MSDSSIWPIDRILSAATSPGQSEPGSNGNEEVLRILQIFNPGALPSEFLMSYSGHSLEGGSYSSAEMQSVYSTAPVDWAVCVCIYQPLRTGRMQHLVNF